MFNITDENFFDKKIIFELKWPKNVFFGPKIAKNQKKIEKFSKKIFFSKSIRNHLKRILKRKYGFRKYFYLTGTEVGIPSVHSVFGGDGGRHS